MSARLILTQITGAVIGVASTGLLVNAVRKATLLGTKTTAAMDKKQNHLTNSKVGE